MSLCNCSIIYKYVMHAERIQTGALQVFMFLSSAVNIISMYITDLYVMWSLTVSYDGSVRSTRVSLIYSGCILKY